MFKKLSLKPGIVDTLGLLAVQNVGLVDQTYKELNYGLADWLLMIQQGGLNYPLGSYPVSGIAGDLALTAYPALGTTVEDVVFNIGFNAPAAALPGTMNYIPVVGYNLIMRFNNFTSMNDFQVRMRYCINSSTGALDDDLNRDILVTPTGDVNFTSEMTFMNVTPTQSVTGTVLTPINAINIPFLNGGISNNKGIIRPIMHRTVATNNTENAVASSLIVLKGVAAPGLSISTKVTPILLTPNAIAMLMKYYDAAR